MKKLIKLAFIALGLIALLLGYLENQKWIMVNWIVAENQTPRFRGLLGFTPGVLLGFYKG